MLWLFLPVSAFFCSGWKVLCIFDLFCHNCTHSCTFHVLRQIKACEIELPSSTVSRGCHDHDIFPPSQLPVKQEPFRSVLAEPFKWIPDCIPLLPFLFLLFFKRIFHPCKGSVLRHHKHVSFSAFRAHTTTIWTPILLHFNVLLVPIHTEISAFVTVCSSRIQILLWWCLFTYCPTLKKRGHICFSAMRHLAKEHQLILVLLNSLVYK